MKRAVIGISPQYDEQQKRIFISEPYEHALLHAGGVPVLLPLHAGKKELRALLLSCNGFLFPGGTDISPFYFNEEVHTGCGKINEDRDKMELWMMKEILTNPIHRKKPVLAICRGVQVMNIAMGGTIFQDIEEYREIQMQNVKRSLFYEKIEHYQKSQASIPTHSVDLDYDEEENDGWLKMQLGIDVIKVNSFHHQNIKGVADGFYVCGTAKDGVIEAIHKKEHRFCLGVQWHPEDLQKDLSHKKIFELFVHCSEK